MSTVALVNPPGWTLHPGGPHIALPLLKGFLKNSNIHADIFDLNIGVAHYHKAFVHYDDVKAACQSGTRAALNKPYFKAEDKLQTVARKYQGKWHAHEGFLPHAYDIATPEHVREFSQQASPYTDYFTQQAIPSLLAKDPALVGITLIVPSQLLSCFEFIRLLRAAGYNGLIVLGGNVITRIYKDMELDWVFLIVWVGLLGILLCGFGLYKADKIGEQKND